MIHLRLDKTAVRYIYQQITLWQSLNVGTINYRMRATYLYFSCLKHRWLHLFRALVKQTINHKYFRVTFETHIVLFRFSCQINLLCFTLVCFSCFFQGEILSLKLYTKRRSTGSRAGRRRLKCGKLNVNN